MKGKKIILILFSLLGSLTISTLLDAGELPEEVQRCLECHARRGIVKKFQNNESVSAYIDAEKFKASVHNFMVCSDCHTDFSSEKHPERRFRSKEQYKIMSSFVCKRCHSEKEIKAKSVHAKLLGEEREGKPHPCTNCHGAHSAIRMTGEKILPNEEEYCLGCHRYKLSMTFKNGETLSLKIDASALEASAHNKLSCSDCHFGFSKSEHPQRNFKSLRDFSIVNSEICRRCHFDKYTKSLESIHYAVLSKGILKAPVCTDCHGSHTIQVGRVEKELIGRRCQKCHGEIFDIYALSVHGKALFNQHLQDVPICIDCHMVHNIVDPRTIDYREKIPEICGSCHANKEIMGRYGLSTDVVKTYLSDFHGVTLSFYRKQREELNKPARPIAVCTDCHGTHNIVSTRATDPAIVKANLVKRCQQCHRGAAEDFPDAWLSHYEPSLNKAPLVFIVSQIYKILIPIMLIGLILQILLHIWRYAINR